MIKEIIVNAGELESRVAILENGRLMELHIERDPKIVGNVYKGRVTKILKGMDAAFVDIGIEQNAFLSVSDVVPQEDDDDGGGGSNGRMNRHELPPITELLKSNQEILAQVVRAPMGSKGARITTRLSLPGRYMVLMLHGGSYVGVSRKIEDVRERHRLRDIANAIRPENYSLIVRTEAEGKTEEELRQDLTFLLDMAHRLEAKAASNNAPALVHGDLNLIMRLIRDAFTRDVTRLVVDSQSAYENILELVGMISPGLKNRVFLYDEPVPIFHAYNIESETERTTRRKVWLPSGGHLVVDQAEALIAIDVNTGRFVGSVELSETVLTTNLQAAEEVARQLRLRDLGGIIVVDFIDMDNPKHRQQVMHAFEEALKRDRAKLKVHNISPLGLVEMTRKRTGESLSDLLTEPCPYCSGIGRIQNVLTMALRVQREIAAAAVEFPATEAFVITAHPRVIASVLGYEGEVQRDLAQYIGHPVYLRAAEDFHPNSYLLERLTLEQVMAAVPHLEEGDVVEGRVINPDPSLSLSPLVMARSVFVVVPELDAPVGALVKVRITQAGTSLAFAEPLAEELRGVRTGSRAHIRERPPLLPDDVLPSYLREERAPRPPRELSLLSPSAQGVPSVEEGEGGERVEPTYERERGRGRRRGSRWGQEAELPVTIQPAPLSADETPEASAVVLEPAEVGEVEGVEGTDALAPKKRRRRRRRGKGGALSLETAAAGGDEGEVEGEASDTEEEAPVAAPEGEATEPATRRRRSRRRRRGKGGTDALPLENAETTAEAPEGETPAAEPATEPAATPEDEGDTEPARRRRPRSRRRGKGGEAQALEMPVMEPIQPVISEEEAAEALQNMLAAMPESTEPPILPAPEPAPQTARELASLVMAAEEIAPEAPVEAEPLVTETSEAAPEKPRRTRTRRPRRTEPEVTEAAPVAEEAAVTEAVPVPEATPAPEEAPAPETADVPELVLTETPDEGATPARRRRAQRRKRTEETPEPEA